MDAEVIKVILFAIQAIFLAFAIMYTFVAIRAIGQFLAYIIRDITKDLPAWIIVRPAILWGIFFFLTKASFTLNLLIHAIG